MGLYSHFEVILHPHPMQESCQQDPTNDTAEEAQAGGVALPCIPRALPPWRRQWDAQSNRTVKFASPWLDCDHWTEGRLVTKLSSQQFIGDRLGLNLLREKTPETIEQSLHWTEEQFYVKGKLKWEHDEISGGDTRKKYDKWEAEQQMCNRLKCHNHSHTHTCNQFICHTWPNSGQCISSVSVAHNLNQGTEEWRMAG